MSAVPLLLAVDTATERASWALVRGEALLGERAVERGRPTAESLLPALDALLADLGVALAAVEGFAVSIGPGSFTGLRIGVATVKGLAFGTGRRAIGVPTLAALARMAPAGGPVVALLDARRGEVYAAGFEDGKAADWLPEGVVPVSGLERRLPPGCRVVGDDVAFGAFGGADAVLLPPPYPGTLAGRVAEIAAATWSPSRSVAAAELVPRYLRRAEAEVKRTGERFETP